MMGNRYDKYKDSGIAWIGEIPEHWKVCKLSTLFFQHKQKNNDTQESNLLSLSYGNIKRKDINTSEGLLPESFENYNIIDKDDIVFRLTDLQNDKRSLRSALCKERGIITSAYIVIRKRSNLNSSYFNHLFRAYDECKVFYGLGEGVRQGMNYDDLRNLEILLPEQTIQQSIAAYLDQKCGEIDELITLQEEMITKLQSYKQSVITEAVTKGLDKNVPLKDSGIEWIGKIPEHWNICQLKRCANIINGYAFNSNHFSKDLGVPVIRIGDIINEMVSFENIVYVQGNNELDKFQVHKNDILIAMSGATVGKIGIYDIEDKAYVNQRVGIIRTKQYGFIKRMFATYGFANYVTLSSAGSAQPNISSDGILNFYIPLPPISEQQTIADYLDQRCSEIDELISIKQQKIEKLKEYKKSLIFECVTGKRKVS
jgi:type I restriction enzyme S subunit